MYLEKLEIQGFKSFANKNKLIFSGMLDDQKRGLTAIVGPNGSGKSNVADSIRWALGEQSIKSLRGKKSEDVIFSGSDQKSQLSLAEVSLFLNNEESVKKNAKQPEAIEKESDLDQIIMSCAEIVITRRLFRNGDGEYLLNGNRVRLSDIQMLLAKANFGQKTYSVIGQGMVENFLSSTAAERKDFFDEATGVKQFQIKRDSALNKLEASYENLQQVDMLLVEIRPRLKSLTRQVEKLKRRADIEGELKETQFNYYGFLWQDINNKLNTFNSQFLDLEKIKIEREKKLEKLGEELNKIRTTDNFREINELQPRLRDLENQKGQYQKKLSKLQAELEVQLEAQGQFDVSWLNNKAGELEAESEKIGLEINSLEKSRPKLEEESLLTKLQEINKEIAGSEEIKRTINRLENEKYNFNKQISKLEAVLEANLEAQGQFDVSWLSNKQEELTLELKKIEIEANELNKDNDRLNSQSLQENLNRIQQELATLNKELSAINDKIRANAKSGSKDEKISQIVEEFLNKLDGINSIIDLDEAKKLILEAKKDFKTKIKATLTGESDEDALRIQKIQQTIIELTEKRQTVNDHLNEERLRLSTISERLRLSVEKQNQIQRELIDIKAKLEKAEIKFDAGKIEAEKITLNKKLTEIEKEISKLELAYQENAWPEKKQQVLEQLQNCRLKDSAINERVKLLGDKKNQTNQELIDIKNKIAKSQTKFDASEIEKEKTELNKLLEEIALETATITSKLEALNQAKEKEKGQMFECQKNIQALQEDINAVAEKLNNLKIESTRQETRLEDLENNIRNDELSIGDIQTHVVSGDAENLSSWQKILANSKNQLEQIGGIDPETEKEYEDTKTRYDFLSTQTEDLNQAVKSLEQIIYELDGNIKSRFDQEFKIISEKFNDYFKILFNGGSAKITKILVEDLEKEDAKNNSNKSESLDQGLSAAEIELKRMQEEKMKKIKFLKKYNAVGLAGIDIQATPPGKKIQAVTMLSGGERALTAIALICAIISANPSPFVVLDEVDAALDESNSERLARILDDLSDKTQFIVITHNRASMRRASILYGVTMQADGVSKLLSVKLDELQKDNKNLEKV
jgi:chromosome segregation protein